jgi:hypothetical protein
LEAAGDASTVDTSIDTKGRKQLRRKPASAKSAAPPEELTGWAKVAADEAELKGIAAPPPLAPTEPISAASPVDMPDLPPELDRRAERKNQVPAEESAPDDNEAFNPDTIPANIARANVKGMFINNCQAAIHAARYDGIVDEEVRTACRLVRDAWTKLAAKLAPDV